MFENNLNGVKICSLSHFWSFQSANVALTIFSIATVTAMPPSFATVRGIVPTSAARARNGTRLPCTEAPPESARSFHRGGRASVAVRPPEFGNRAGRSSFFLSVFQYVRISFVCPCPLHEEPFFLPPALVKATRDFGVTSPCECLDTHQVTLIIASTHCITIKVNRYFVQVKESVQLTWF